MNQFSVATTTDLGGRSNTQVSPLRLAAGEGRGLHGVGLLEGVVGVHGAVS